MLLQSCQSFAIPREGLIFSLVAQIILRWLGQTLLSLPSVFPVIPSEMQSIDEESTRVLECGRSLRSAFGMTNVAVIPSEMQSIDEESTPTLLVIPREASATRNLPHC